MKRLEFSRKVRAEIILRAAGNDGLVCCEGCGLVLGKKPYEIDHIIPDALRDPSDRTPLTADDGQLLGKECCHRGGKTANDIRTIRKVQRVRDKFTGAMPRSRTPMPFGKSSSLKRKLDGSIVRRMP